MKIYTKRVLQKLTRQYYNDGFRDAVDSVVKAIESKDKVILGNNTSFVGMTASAPVTMVGNSQIITCSYFTMDKKWKDENYKMGRTTNNIKITGKL